MICDQNKDSGFLETQVEDKYKWWKSIAVFFFCALSAFAVLFFATKTSPAYPFQDGVDANTFFSVGKSLFNGKVLYRDIYEHKGLILYLLYGCAYLLSHETFIGVFFIELLCGTFTLWYAWKIVCLYEKKAYLFLLPVFGCALWSGDAFSYGGQPEELVLPVLLWGLYTFLELGKKASTFRENDKDGGRNIYELPLSKVFLCGLWSAVLFWMKYTLTGFFLGLVIIMFFVQIKRRNFVYLIKCALAFVAGFISVTVPVLIYFSVNDALDDLWQVYFYNLIFRYNERDIGMSRIEYSLRKVLLTFWRNKRFSLMIVAGVTWFAIGGPCKKKNVKRDLFTTLGLLLLCIVTTVSIYYSRQYNRYWGEVLALFSVTGLVLVNRGCDVILSLIKKSKASEVLDRIKNKEIIAAAASLVIAMAVIRTFGDNTYLLKYDREQMPQYIFKELILEREGGNLDELKILNYESLDLGLHTVLDNVPFLKYFCDCNIALPELYEAQDNAIINGDADYVICISPIEVGEEKYELIATVPFEMEWENYYMDYYLYALKK